MGACLAGICGAGGDAGPSKPEASESGREFLKAYHTDTIARLDKGTPPSSELKGKIMPASTNMGACLAGICGARGHAGPSKPEASESGRQFLKAYLTDTIARLDKGTPPSSELKGKIMPAVVASIKRLSAGAPQQLRDSFKNILVEKMVIPSYMASQSQFKEALVACQKLCGDAPAPAPPTPAGNSPEPTEEELKSLNGVLERLWKMDEDRRLAPRTDYSLSLGSRGFSESISQHVLFEKVNSQKVYSNPVMKAFIALLDNYEADSDQAEIVTQEEKLEMDSFMHLLMRTPHMRYAHNVLRKWKPDDVPSDYREFEGLVFKIWFTNYGIGRGPAATSGFEHTFVGEIDVEKNEVQGMHNWIRYWLLEKKGQVRYRGYCGITDQDHRCVSVRLSWLGEDKDVSTFLVGTSVAFEFAMYTIAFLGHDGNCDQSGIYIGDLGPIRICTYPWNTFMGNCVRSAFIRT